VCLLVASVGCDGTAPSGVRDAAPGPPSPLEAFPAAVARATCQKIDQCCSAADRSRVIGAGEDLATCEMLLGSFYGRQFALTQSLAQMSRIVFDAGTMETCLATYGAAACGAPGLAAAQTCAQVFTGSVAEGGACQSGFECASHHCASVAGSGQCRPQKGAGQPCARGGECQSGVCWTSLLGGTCASQAMGPSCGGDGFWMAF
jgi:hypothetical protein